MRMPFDQPGALESLEVMPDRPWLESGERRKFFERHRADGQEADHSQTRSIGESA